MHLFASLERSRSCQTAANLASRAILPFLYPLPSLRKTHQTLSSRRRPRKRTCHDVRTLPMDNFFITALVSAGTCHGHRTLSRGFCSTSKSCSSHHKPSRRGLAGILHEFHTTV